jgi:predicted phosphodiesterase
MSEQLRRIAVIGDVHACDRRLALLLAHLGEQGLDLVACVGDIVDGPGDPNAAAALLQAHDVTVVRGNHDRWILEGVLRDLPDAHAFHTLSVPTVAYLTALPPSRDLTLAGGTSVLLCHGLLDNDMNKITADDYGYALEVNDEYQALLRDGRRRVVVKGHRHRAAIWNAGPLTIVDAGSLLEECETCGVIVDGDAGTITPLRIGPDGVYPGAPEWRFETG